MSGRPLLALAVASLCLGGCSVGPDFARPEAPHSRRYTHDDSSQGGKAAGTPATGAQQLLEGRDIPGDWWTAFGSPPLARLVEQALRHNPGIKAAQAALVAARENVLVQKAGAYPSVGTSFAASRARSSSQLSPTPQSGALDYSLYTPQVSVSYQPDVFGLNRRLVESRQAQAEGARHALAAADITLCANVVVAAVQEAALREQVVATQELVDASARALAVLEHQEAAGYASRLDVAQQRAQLAQWRATLPALRRQLAQQQDLLAVLAGIEPADAADEQFVLSDFTLPKELPLSLPSQLVGQRPDVLQAEENVHAASAQVGVALAARLPSLAITGNAGSMALELGRIFTPGAMFWDVGASVAQPLFQMGALRHQQRAAQATYEQALEQYKGTVQLALANVADVLHALEEDADALAAVEAQEHASADALALARQQWDAGYGTYLAVIIAEQAHQQAVLGRITAVAARLSDTAALFLALGGGWWNREPRGAAMAGR